MLLPAFIAKVLKASPASYGLILGAMGLGTIITSAGLLPRKPLATEKTYYSAVATGGIVFGLIGLAWNLPAMLILGFMIGCTVAVTWIVSATAIQVKVNPSYLGRVHSLLQTMQMALLPLMYNLYGRLGKAVSLRLLFSASGLVILLVALAGLG